MFQALLRFRSCSSSVIELEAFLPIRNTFCFLVGLELGKSGPFQVAEAGSFGGGMLSCVGCLGAGPASA